MSDDAVVTGLLKRVLPRSTFIRMRRSYRKKRGLKPTTDDLRFLVEDKKTPPELRQMVESFLAQDVDRYLSKFWLQMAQNHVQRLLERGYENFKQTIATEYFTFAQDSDQSQLGFLKRPLPAETVRQVAETSAQLASHPYFSPAQNRHYNLLTTLLWEYATQQLKPEILRQLEEPLIGNPPVLPYDGRLISQDIANSTLEYEAITDGLKDRNALHAVMEVGAGYGRVGYVFLKLHPNLRYFIVDIPPTLYISQRYLSEVFPEKTVFRFRDFDSYTQVQHELDAADLVFLMPHQLNLLPPKSLDLFIAINCLNEMTAALREYYFQGAHRLAKHMYFKCHKVAETPYDGPVLEGTDYPVVPAWKPIYWRDCKVQDQFFEALYVV